MPLNNPLIPPHRPHRTVGHPKDAIPAIDNPQFLTADEADEEYAPDELILGVEFNGDARAYSINLLSSHEIVNDTVGDVKISVTW
jgi:hypothetical protein